MAIKRLSINELIARCESIFYDCITKKGTMLLRGRNIDCEGISALKILHEEHIKDLQENTNRINMYERELRESPNGVLKSTLVRELNYLRNEKDLLEYSNMLGQKQYYEVTGKVDYAGSSIRIPLNKLINSYYDDLVLEVRFFDDISTVHGKLSYLEDILAKGFYQELDLFVRNNIEISHMSLQLSKNNVLVAAIVMVGNPNFEENLNPVTVLGAGYADFTTLTLEDTMKIANNDLRQFLQDRIDLDKEMMYPLAKKTIGTDTYSVFKCSLADKKDEKDNKWLGLLAPKVFDYYIRYTCPSTGRVYYNGLNLRILSLSKYFVPDDYSSYIDAWWSITHIGADPYGKAMFRC